MVEYRRWAVAILMYAVFGVLGCTVMVLYLFTQLAAADTAQLSGYAIRLMVNYGLVLGATGGFVARWFVLATAHETPLGELASIVLAYGLFLISVPLAVVYLGWTWLQD